jgi:SWIM zinc finger
VSLAAALAAFDEATLSTLASKGVVRRAARDVDEGRVTLGEDGGDYAIVAADGEEVRIDARGPAKATCTCPAPGICRHRVAAALLIGKASREAAPSPAAQDAPPIADEIAAIDEAAMRRFAGRAGWRAALEMAEAGCETRQEGIALVIRLGGEATEIRYLRGLGIENMVSKASAARRKALHVAALIAVRAAAGIAPAETASPAPAPSAADIDRGFLETVRSALADACRTGLSLAPLVLEERLFALSVSSRADAMPRLGALLRAIARMVRDRRERSFRFDPDHCLGQIAAADALARALLAGDPDRRTALLGTARQAYEEIGPLRLHGLGAETWRAEGGARGATGFFYDPEGDRWFTASLARGPGQDPSFDARHAFAHEAIFGGETLASLSRAEIAFDSVAASPQHRLSTSGAGRPDVLGTSAISDWPCVFTRWQPLALRLRSRLSGGLAAPPPAMEPVILRPRRTGTPWFDDLRQELRWAIEDEAGAWLILSLAYDPDRAARFDHLAATAFRSGFSGEIVAAATITGTAFELRPIAMVDSRGLRSLDLEEVPAQKRSFMAGWRARRGPGAMIALPRPATLALLDRIATELTGLAETGCRPIGTAGDERLERLAGQAGRAGLGLVEEAIGRVRGDPAYAGALLAGYYGVDQVRRQLIELPLGSP